MHHYTTAIRALAPHALATKTPPASVSLGYPNIRHLCTNTDATTQGDLRSQVLPYKTSIYNEHSYAHAEAFTVNLHVWHYSMGMEGA